MVDQRLGRRLKDRQRCAELVSDVGDNGTSHPLVASKRVREPVEGEAEVFELTRRMWSLYSRRSIARFHRLDRRGQLDDWLGNAARDENGEDQSQHRGNPAPNGDVLPKRYSELVLGTRQS